jgi:hypothetical protein
MGTASVARHCCEIRIVSIIKNLIWDFVRYHPRNSERARVRNRRPSSKVSTTNPSPSAHWPAAARPAPHADGSPVSALSEPHDEPFSPMYSLLVDRHLPAQQQVQAADTQNASAFAPVLEAAAAEPYRPISDGGSTTKRDSIVAANRLVAPRRDESLAPPARACTSQLFEGRLVGFYMIRPKNCHRRRGGTPWLPTRK